MAYDPYDPYNIGVETGSTGVIYGDTPRPLVGQPTAQPLTTPDYAATLKGASAVAGGVGAATAAGMDIYYQQAQYALQRKQYALALQAAAQGYAKQQADLVQQQGLQASAFQRQAGQLAGQLAGRGLGNSSIAQQDQAYQQYLANSTMDQDKRQYAFNTTTYENQKANIELQKRQAELAKQHGWMSEALGIGEAVVGVVLAIATLGAGAPLAAAGIAAATAATSASTMAQH